MGQTVIWFTRPQELGATLRAARERQGFSLEELGDQLHMTGSNIARIERGERSAELAFVQDAARVLHCPRLTKLAVRDILAAAAEGPRDAI